MTRIVIVGEIYNADLSIGGGPIYPGGGQPSHPWVPPQGAPGSPSHPIYNPAYPDQGLPPGSPGSPSHPIIIPGVPPNAPGSPTHPIYITGNPSHPIYIPGYPDQGLPPGSPGSPSHPWVPPGNYPDQGLPPVQPPAGGTEVPEDVYTPAPVPEEIASQYVVSVYDPKTMAWTTKSYPPR